MSSNQNNSQKKMSSIARKLNRRNTRRRIATYFRFDLLLFLIAIVVFIVTTELSANSGNFATGEHRTVTINSVAVRELDEKLDSIPGWRQQIIYIDGNRELVNKLVVYTVSDVVYTPVEGTAEDENSVHVETRIVSYELPILTAIIYGLIMTFALFLLQVLFAIIWSPVEGRKVKKILSPLSSMAIKADELARMEFDDSRFSHQYDFGSQNRNEQNQDEQNRDAQNSGAQRDASKNGQDDTAKYHDLQEKLSNMNPEDSLKLTEGDQELAGLEIAINNLLMRMRETNMQQARFVNDASHELRTPIAVIEGYANMLARWGREDEKVLDESITAIQHESAHMKYLVEQLLFLARGDSGKTVLKFENVSLNELMREIYEESLMIDEGHVYKFGAPEEDVKIDCDPALLKQAVRILVDNASKYTAEHDEILISVGKNEENKAYLQVQDNGIGMAESDVAHIFERFYRSDEVRSYKGTGLGLSIAKWIVDKHRGHFEIISRPEVGTRIRIVL